MYLIVVGAGAIGTRVAELALQDGHDVGVFDKKAERCTAITKKLDVLAFHADATQETNLREAGVEEADAIIAATRQDPVNLMVMTVAERLEVPKRVSVLNNPNARELFERHGAQVVDNPSRVAAQHLLYAARHPGVGSYVPVTGGVQLFKADVEADSPVDGIALREAELPQGVIVAAVERAGRFLLPRGDTIVYAGDVVTLLATESLVDAALLKFRSRSRVA